MIKNDNNKGSDKMTARYTNKEVADRVLRHMDDSTCSVISYEGAWYITSDISNQLLTREEIENRLNFK